MQPASPLEAFLKKYQQDQDAGAVRTLEEYQRMFPGADSKIAEAFGALLRDETLVREGEHETSDPIVTTLSSDGSEHEGLVGSSLGHYRIDEELGRGGQGMVFLATDERLGRRVALKVLSGLASHSSRTLMRFRREAELASGLSDPGICTVYETGTIDQIPFIAMQFVEGRSLSHLLKDERAGAGDGYLAGKSTKRPTGTDASQTSNRTDNRVARCVRLVRDVARSLHTAHENNLVHRDIKPGNIMVSDDGRPVILDFGIAHAEDDEAHGLTHTDDVIGTPAYMAPEQVSGNARAVDRRTDVYALGVTLFECVTLQRPFQAPTREALYAEIMVGRRPSASSMSSEVGRDLDVIIQTAMDADPDRRYQSAEALADDLDRLLAHQPIQARPASLGLRLMKWAARNPAVAGLLSCVFVLLVSGLVVTTSLWRQSERDKSLAEQETKRADANAKEAMESLRGFTMVSDSRRLEMLQDDVPFLYPPSPERLAAIDKWLAEVDEILAREPIFERKLEEIRRDSRPLTLEEIRREDTYKETIFLNELYQRQEDLLIAAKDATYEEPARRKFETMAGRIGRLRKMMEEASLKEFAHSFEDKDQEWLHFHLRHLIRSMQIFKNREDRGYPVADVLHLRRQCELIEKLSLVDARDLWTDAIQRIASVEESPKYGGLKIEPQLGLVPLGPDPDSGLWEFAHILTGTMPVRGKDKKLAIGSEGAIVLVLLPGGECTVGARPPAHEGESGPYVDPASESLGFKPRKIRLAPFFMAKHELTMAQWETVDADLLRYKPGESGTTLEEWQRAGRAPLVDVSFGLARDFTQRIGMQLPTEAQWEYACRAGTDTIWWTGDQPESLVGQRVNIGDEAARSFGLIDFQDGYARRAPVDSMAANAFGLHHMIGNVWELTRDGQVVDDDVFFPGDGHHTTVEPEDMVIRGGGFNSAPRRATSAVRGLLAVESIAKTIGFRPARKLHGKWSRP